ncbi:MAG: hypothetical protein ACRDJ5_00890 [Actinomycetota bacterium]
METITPAVHGGRRLRYLGALVLHVAGATLSAAVFGLLLGGLGRLLAAPWGVPGALLVGGVAALYAGREALGLPIPIPDRHRQVPEWWRSFFSPAVSSLLYGLGLGIGFLTFLTFGTFVAVAVAAVVSGDPLTGALVCGAFGIARGLSVLAAAWAGSADEASGVVDRLEDLAVTRWPRAANAAVLVATAGVAATSVA